MDLDAAPGVGASTDGIDRPQQGVRVAVHQPLAAAVPTTGDGEVATPPSGGGAHSEWYWDSVSGTVGAGATSQLKDDDAAEAPVPEDMRRYAWDAVFCLAHLMVQRVPDMCGTKQGMEQCGPCRRNHRVHLGAAQVRSCSKTTPW
jgi:hypothetical protein